MKLKTLVHGAIMAAERMKSKILTIKMMMAIPVISNALEY
jgi:hypothetical protein